MLESMRVLVKVCGVRSLEEARVAAECGADYLGFNFWPRSPRYVEPSIAAEIIGALDKRVASVGVFVNEDADTVAAIASKLDLTALQLHGDESPDYCQSFNRWQVIKAFRVDAAFDPEVIASYSLSMALLDASVKGSYGGTGRVFEWDIAKRARRYAPIMLAGGLDASNVTDAIRTVHPAAIDVCSGVEAEPGRKDLDKLRRFLKVAREASQLATEEN